MKDILSYLMSQKNLQFDLPLIDEALQEIKKIWLSQFLPKDTI